MAVVSQDRFHCICKFSTVTVKYGYETVQSVTRDMSFTHLFKGLPISTKGISFAQVGVRCHVNCYRCWKKTQTYHSNRTTVVCFYYDKRLYICRWWTRKEAWPSWKFSSRGWAGEEEWASAPQCVLESRLPRSCGETAVYLDPSVPPLKLYKVPKLHIEKHQNNVEKNTINAHVRIDLCWNVGG